MLRLAADEVEFWVVVLWYRFEFWSEFDEVVFEFEEDDEKKLKMLKDEVFGGEDFCGLGGGMVR